MDKRYKFMGGFIMETVYSAISVLSKLEEKYKKYLRPEIIEVAIIQTKEYVYLEVVELEVLEDGLEKHTTIRDNLEFIMADYEKEELFFKPEDSVEVNSRKFINDFSPYYIINTTDLFHREACEQISKKYNVFGVDK